jgi:sn-glycerol 3-phosphate transport system substrate-binding protein
MQRLVLAIALIFMGPLAVAQEIVLRHALQGGSLDALSTLVLRFNDEQKGKAKVVLEDLAGISDQHRLPQMALLDPADSLRFFGTRPRFKPLNEVMREGGGKLDGVRFYPQIADAVDDVSGKLQGLPMALGVPVLYYNKEAFRKAGLDPDTPPRTWWEVQQTAGALFDAGFKCPLTTSDFTWIHLENVSSQHDEPMLARSGKSERVLLNNLVHVKHVALLASWYKSFYFHYFGPGREGDQKFLSGECAMLTGESPLYADLGPQLGFPVGVAALPHYDDVRGNRPADVLPDGAALVVLPGRKKDEYKVVARFISFLLRPQSQQEWVRATGFLPMTPTAVDALRQAGVPPAILNAAEKRLSAPRRGDARTKFGFGRSKVREILNEEIEFVWGNTKPAKEALDTAMVRVNGTAETSAR